MGINEKPDAIAAKLDAAMGLHSLSIRELREQARKWEQRSSEAEMEGNLKLAEQYHTNMLRYENAAKEQEAVERREQAQYEKAMTELGNRAAAGRKAKR